MKGKKVVSILLISLLLLSGCTGSSSMNPGSKIQEKVQETKVTVVEEEETDIKKQPVKECPEGERPVFQEVSVHDPSIIKVDDTYYIYGSHLASAKSQDLIQWTQISAGPQKGNKLIPDPQVEMKEALTWAETDTFWAPDVVQLEDGRFYLYYCVCRGDSPLSALGIAVSNDPEGPYEDLGIILKSGMWGQPSEDGKVYDANHHPNVVDPHTFFDKEGRLWMVYGSYSGGIFMMEMDTATGFPLPDQGYGKKLLGAYHPRIEGPYILYSPETDYYYLFLSFGGLGTDGGYNIRVARSKNPDGPYYDSMGQDMILAKGKPGEIFYDPNIEPYGTKLMGSYQFKKEESEPAVMTEGYRSPGHNSAYYDEDTGRYYLIFHTRFAMKGEAHQVRVHQMFMNEDGWPVIAPYRYAGEILDTYTEEEVIGEYKLIDHGRDISAEIHLSTTIKLQEDGRVVGSRTGTWELKEGNKIIIYLDNKAYKGFFLQQYDTNNKYMVMTFTALNEKDGTAIWGSAVAKNPS